MARQHAAPIVLDSLESPSQIRRLERVRRSVKGQEGPYYLEQLLQKLIDAEPKILPVEELEPSFANLRSVCQELLKARRRQSDHFAHRMYRCSQEFSFFKAAEAYDLQLGWLEDVVADPRFPWKPTTNDKSVHKIPVGHEHIVPDTPIIRLTGAKTLCAHVEYDMGTERLNSPNKDSIQSKVRRYTLHTARLCVLLEKES